jgi:hypothetical protein
MAAIVQHLTLDGNRLTRFTFRGSEAAIVEGEHVSARRSEALGEWFQPGILGAAEAVGHHHHRSTVRARQSIGLGAEKPSVTTHAMGIERNFEVAHAVSCTSPVRSVIP